MEKEEKPLSIGQAAFLLLRVRRVFKKKIASKKEKNNFAQDVVVFPKGDGSPLIPGRKKSRIPPLIRSRTVPAIIVPFSILQAQLAKNSCAGGGANANASGAGTSGGAGGKGNYPQSKSDFATPGVDYIQFLTGSGSPSSSVAGTPPAKRESHFLGLSNPSIYRDNGGSESTSPIWHHHHHRPNLNLSNVSLANDANQNASAASSGSGSSTPIHPMGAFIPPPSGVTLDSVGAGTGRATSGKGLGRFARLLNSSGSQTPSVSAGSPSSSSAPRASIASWTHPPQVQFAQQQLLQQPGAGSTTFNVNYTFATPGLPRRRRSLEDDDLQCRPRAVSIDSLMKNHMLCLPEKVTPKRYSTSSACPTNFNRIDQKLHEGFVIAVEQGNTAKVKTILETCDVDINSLTAEGLSLLNVAVIQRDREMVRLLLSNGATEKQYGSRESINDQLNGMVTEAENKSEDLMARILKCSTFGNLPAAQLKELEKEYHMWEKLYKKFRKMRTEYTQIRPPDAPIKAFLDVISPTSVKIRIQEDESGNNAISTKYKMEWTTVPDFKNEDSIRVMEIFDLRRMETVLNDLVSGTRYYFRVACGNCKGYGAYKITTPAAVIPSSWYDIEGKKERYSGKSMTFDKIFTKIRAARPEIRTIHLPSETGPSSVSSGSSGLISGQSGTGVGSSGQKKTQKIISIKQLFTAAPKFQKSFKRGAFLCCVIYSEDKLLVTTEEFLPTIEIDETFPSSTLQNDFHWLFKVASTWEDVKSLKQDMEKSGSASTFHFRLKLLQAAAAMQSALGIADLGRLYYKTIRDKNNSVIIISTINYMRSTKMVSSLNVRWIPTTKMNSRKATDDVSDVLINSLQEQILYHQVSNIPLGKGLYLGWLKLASSMDVLKILVPERTPNILPHSKIRDNPHVSSEEWLLIQKMVKSKSEDSLNFETNNNSSMLMSNSSSTSRVSAPGAMVNSNTDDVDENSEANMESGSASESTSLKSTTSSLDNPGTTTPSTFTTTQPLPMSTLKIIDPYSSSSAINSNNNYEFNEAQEIFRAQINSALRKLFSFLDIDYESSMNHRLYNVEVIELNSSVSIIVIFPPVENVCLVAGQSDRLLQRSDLITIPVQVFEMIHLNTYQKEFISRYARLSAILEVDTILALHNQREAFSTEETALAKSRLSQLQEFQSQVDTNWKGSRWVIDLVTISRDKSSRFASIRALAQFDLKTSSESIVSADASLHKSEEIAMGILHSKSDQQLLPFRLGIGGLVRNSGLKFSRSENQLANICNSSGSSTGSNAPSIGGINETDRGGDSQLNYKNQQYIVPTHPAGGRKVSVPVQYFGSRSNDQRSETDAIDDDSSVSARNSEALEKMHWNPNLYTSHSQSDSTISHSALSTQDQLTGSSSVHNLFIRQYASSSQINSCNIIPSVVVSVETDGLVQERESLVPPVAAVDPVASTASATATSLAKMVTPKGAAQTTATTTGTATSTTTKAPSHNRVGSEPPPVPPRKTAPPPPPHAAAAPSLSDAGNVDLRVFPTSSSESPSRSTSSTPSTPPPIGGGSPIPSYSIVQVYAAYECGLNPGTSVRLKITSHTTARQVVDIVVRQLNSEIEGKGLAQPIYDRTQDFCLVSVIGVRERCLRNDFKPLHLQMPWKNGRLYVRKKAELTAAITMNSRGDSTYL